MVRSEGKNVAKDEVQLSVAFDPRLFINHELGAQKRDGG